MTTEGLVLKFKEYFDNPHGEGWREISFDLAKIAQEYHIVYMMEIAEKCEQLEKKLERLQEIREKYEDIIGSEWGGDSFLIEKD